MNNLPIFECFINDNFDEEIGLALVNKPAIQVNFEYFSEDEAFKYMKFNDEERIVKGPAMIPNKLIYRNDNLGQRYVFFGRDTIRKFAENLMKKTFNKFNLNHSNRQINVNVLESYFAQKANEFGVEEGSWIVSLRVLEDAVWNDIKSGKINGFSIEGMFNNVINKFFDEELKTTDKNNMNDIKEKLMKAINSILFEETVETKLEETVEVETKEEVVEEVKEEVVEEEVKLEETEKVEETVEVEEVKLEEEVKEEVVESKFEDEMLEVIKSLKEEVSNLRNELNNVNTKVDKFSETEIPSKIEKEEVDTYVSTASNKALRFFGK